jgi:transcriptional regulator with XRE-family HTH domain
MINEHITPSLCRAGRAILNWSMEDLAERAGVSVSTIRDYENGSRTPLYLTLKSVAQAFAEEGIEFVGGQGEKPGLRLQREDLRDNPPPRRKAPPTK